MDEDRKNNRCSVCGAPSGSESLCARCASRTTGDQEGAKTPTPNDSPSGILLEGKYRLLDEIGRGGMGTVFRAFDESLDRMVAVKFLLPEHQAEPSLVHRFRREARAMASVRHENVLQIYSFGNYGSTSFFVMEYIEGQTADEMLTAALGRRELIPVQEVTRLLDQMCAGLESVHRAGVVHRDVKPGNVMVHEESRRVVIMDFGIGRRYQPGDNKRTMAPGGTPAYMAPEVISGKQMDPDQEKLADIYALGVTAYELYTGVLPLLGETWVDIFQAHLAETPKSPCEHRDLPDGLEDVILKCLLKKPEDRYRSCEEIREALQPFVIVPATAPTPTPAPPKAQAKTPLPKKPGAPSEASRHHAKVRIIVADPDPGFRTMVYQCAEDVFPGCRFKAARTTLTALDIARKTPPEVMVAPLHDSQLNGLEFAATLWGEPELQKVKLILTAERIAASERKMLEGMGVHRVLIKPIDQGGMSEVFQEISHTLRSTQAATAG